MMSVKLSSVCYPLVFLQFSTLLLSELFPKSVTKLCVCLLGGTEQGDFSDSCT